jgi:rhodanese-related sulfurtransferase
MSMAAAPVPSVDRTEISREELRRRLHDPSLILVHTLTADSYAAGHIPGALSLPAADVTARAHEVLPDRTAEIVVYCGSFTCPVAERAAGLLRDLGYTNLRHYRGGLADWTGSGGELEPSLGPAPDVVTIQPMVPRPTRISARQRRPWGAVLLDTIERQSPSRLLAAWLAMIIACSAVYSVAGLSARHGLFAGGERVAFNLHGLATALYFSFVTATSVGYGDVVPVGAARIVAIVEAVSGLLIFGAVVAKFVSRRQDELVREIHRVTFEDRLDRVQTSLHLVLSELQAIAALCDDGKVRADRIGPRLESAALVFAGELRAIHDLLYRPQWAPEEPILGAILASLAASMRELRELLTCLPPGFMRSPTLEGALTTVARLADEICGHCVPFTYAPALTVWMDRIQTLARRLT